VFGFPGTTPVNFFDESSNPVFKKNMNTETATPVLITCLTHLLVGSGKSNYGVIDQLVQRDPATDLPCVNGSGIKGALKEFCFHAVNSGKTEMSLKYIFGSEKKNEEDTQAGAFSFWQADLLSMPVRCDQHPFVHITAPVLLYTMAEKMEIAGHPQAADWQAFAEAAAGALNGNAAVSDDPKLEGATLEDDDIIIETARLPLPEAVGQWLPQPLAIVSDEVLKRLTDDMHLPVIPRNSLLNGESKNLWYEQVLPRQSRLVTCIQRHSQDTAFAGLGKLLSENLVQVGSNATIGYGYCRFAPMGVAASE
jgi:CRISPR-associated protein Cmr4